MARLARLAFAVGVLINTYLSVMPPDGMPKVQIWDKASHATAYALLACAAVIGFRKRLRVVAICVGVFAVGLVLEGIQGLLPYRDASVADVMANALGVMTGALLALLLVRLCVLVGRPI